MGPLALQIIHRDLKPENILTDDQVGMCTRTADFSPFYSTHLTGQLMHSLGSTCPMPRNKNRADNMACAEAFMMVWLRLQGAVKLADFGFARPQTQGGQNLSPYVATR